MSRKQAQIIKAAGKCFLEEGFAISMDKIAGRAGVSKQTIYNHYQNKESLFRDIIKQTCASIQSPFSNNSGEKPPDEFLRYFAENLLNVLLADETINMYRLIVAKAPEFPEIAEVFYATGPDESKNKLQAYFEQVTKEGKLHIAEPALAAEQFCGMVRDPLFTRVLLGLQAKPTAEEIKDQARNIVQTFLHGHNKVKYW